MSQMDSQIIRFIKRIRRRIMEQNMLRFGAYGVIGGFGLAVIFSVIALFVPWYYATLFALAAAIMGIIAGIIVGIVKRPGMKEAALRLDQHGFHERLITSYELVGKEDAFSNMQKQDTARRIGEFQVRKTFPLKLSWQRLLTMLGLAAIFVIVSFIPTAAKEQAAEYQEVVKQINEEVQKIENAIEHIEKMDELSEAEKESMLSVLEEARQELQEAGNKDELSRAKERISVKMAQESGQTEHRGVREELQYLSAALSEQEKTPEQQLAEDLRDLQQDLQNLNANTSQSDRQAIANELQRLGQQTGNQTMQQASQNLLNNTLSQQQMQNLQQAVANQQNSMPNNNQLANNNQNGQNNQNNQNGQNNQNNSNNQNGQNNQNNSNNQNGQNNQNNPNNQNGQNNQNDPNSQNGQNNQNNQNGQGNQSGQGSQSGQGNQAGQGSQNGQNGQSGTGYDTGGPEGSQQTAGTNGQMITIPNRELQDNESLDGKVNTDGTGITQQGGEAWAGTSVDYQQVIGNYSQNAYNRVESSNYPSGVQDIVKSYFEELNQ